MLDQDAVLQQRHLRQVAPLPDRHDAFHGLPAGQELGLGQDLRAPAGGVPRVAPALPLGLQPGRPADALHLVGRCVCRARGRRTGLGQPRLPDMHDGVVGIVLTGGFVTGGAAPTTTPAAVAGTAARPGVRVGIGIVVGVVIGIFCRSVPSATDRLKPPAAIAIVSSDAGAVSRSLILTAIVGVGHPAAAASAPAPAPATRPGIVIAVAVTVAFGSRRRRRRGASIGLARIGRRRVRRPDCRHRSTTHYRRLVRRAGFDRTGTASSTDWSLSSSDCSSCAALSWAALSGACRRPPPDRPRRRREDPERAGGPASPSAAS